MLIVFLADAHYISNLTSGLPSVKEAHRWVVSQRVEFLMVNPTIEHDELYMRQVLEMTSSFRLAFQFQSARVIEIESEIVKLVPIREVHS